MKVTIYTTSVCPYCAAAKTLLSNRQVNFTEIDVSTRPDLREEMIRRSGRRTVPQIFIGETHVGGYDDLAALDGAGRLNALLQENRV
ncbi:MAG: glutaredoxin 3 [Gammaproteobacteria bacterium]|nr:glutaredoxin 3 [Gammaproteobacteria bacterium]MCP5139802.1 glutaredoxin 3 [Chromatiales bacterium]